MTTIKFEDTIEPGLGIDFVEVGSEKIEIPSEYMELPKKLCPSCKSCMVFEHLGMRIETNGACSGGYNMNLYRCLDCGLWVPASDNGGATMVPLKEWR